MVSMREYENESDSVSVICVCSNVNLLLLLLLKDIWIMKWRVLNLARPTIMWNEVVNKDLRSLHLSNENAVVCGN